MGIYNYIKWTFHDLMMLYIYIDMYTNQVIGVIIATFEDTAHIHIDAHHTYAYKPGNF